MALKSQKEASLDGLMCSYLTQGRPPGDLAPQPWGQMEAAGGPLPVQGLWASLEEAISLSCFSFLSYILSSRFRKGMFGKDFGRQSKYMVVTHSGTRL